MIDEFFHVLLANDLHLFSLNGEVSTKDSSGNLSASSTMAEMSSSVAAEEFRIMDFDGDGAA